MKGTATHKYHKEFITKFNVSFLRKSNAGWRDSRIWTNGQARARTHAHEGENLTIFT
jgi:hypothetical protein